MRRACALGYSAIALTDECSVAGSVRALLETRSLKAKGHAIDLIIGAEFRLTCGLRFVALAKDRHGYGRLCRLITLGRRAAPKGEYSLTRADVVSCLEHCLLLWLPGMQPNPDEGVWFRKHFGDSAWIAVELLRGGQDRKYLETLRHLSETLDLPLVASGDVHMHERRRRHLQDALTAIRLNVPLAEAGWHLYANGERHLRDRARLARLYPRELLEETQVIARQCRFSLEELRYEYPHELVPPGETPTSYLRKLTKEGAHRRWPGGPSSETWARIEHELALIAELRYEPFFLTVYDIVQYARSRDILCQGRGSSANSLVCYCLGVTAVDPGRASLLFERFISRARNEPPDIDIDFEHDRREEVIQYVYNKYGRERAAIAATVIMYRPRSALRDLGKAFGLDPLQVKRLAQTMQWWDGKTIAPERVREAGFDPASPVIARIVKLAHELIGFPRHLSQHVGGFVVSEGPLYELVPIENAAMPERTVVQWDKNDLNDLGLLKVDLLGLGMLTALKHAFSLVNVTRGTSYALGTLPEEPQVFEMISNADTVGVFQVESRAQMAMLPRLRPENFYDLVIEVAIVRPGPIQGEMVHPYLKRREERRRGVAMATGYPPALEKVLGRTLGVPIFQEQVMQLAIEAAGFSADEADRLRRAMGGWERHGNLAVFEEKLVSGMLANGFTEEFARRIFKQIRGFGEYGFPESHAASFALLVYDSAWLKFHEPAAFTCALLNSQPMGFYSPAQLVRDAREHGVEVRPVRVESSYYDCTLELSNDGGQPALRLGLRMVKSLSEAGAKRIPAARAVRAFTSAQDLAERAALDRGDLEALAAAGALASLSGNRHLAFWEVAGTERETPLAPRSKRPPDAEEGRPLLSTPTQWQTVLADYHSVGLTLGAHPMALLRERLDDERLLRASELGKAENGAFVRVAGIVLLRQHPSSAKGVIFMTIEDETGHVNIIVWDRVAQTQRRPLLESRLLEVQGRLQHQEGVTHVVASRLVDRSVLLGSMLSQSRDFH